jgi:hypothetical protein
VRYDAAIDLGAETITADSIGQQVATVAWTSVYANRFNLSRDEFYTAGRSGLKPECVYQLRACDYGGETRARVGTTEYDVISADDRGEWTRLTLQRRVAHGD